MELIESETVVSHSRDTSNDYFSCEEGDEAVNGDERSEKSDESLNESRDRGSFVETQVVSDVLSEEEVSTKLLYAPADFVMDTAALMWNFSHAMYLVGNALHPQAAQEIQHLIEDPAYFVTEAINDDASGEVRCNIFESEDRVVVAFSFPFRGIGSPGNALVEHTAPLLGISADARCADVEADNFPSFRAVMDRRNARVQGPLWDRYLRVRSKLLASMRELHSERPRPVYATGHSGGGALAALLGYDLRFFLNIPCVAVYTFGSPPLGNAAYRREYNSQVRLNFNIATVGDVVHTPHAPYGPIIDVISISSSIVCRSLSLQHVGDSVLLDRGGNMLLDPQNYEHYLNRVLSKEEIHMAHRTDSYTLTLMRWSYRAHGPKYSPLWPSCLHEIKLRCPRKVLVEKCIAGYLNASKVGGGRYAGGSRICVRVLRWTRPTAEKCFCVVSCGAPGVHSSFWEVKRTPTGEKKVGEAFLPGSIYAVEDDESIASTISPSNNLFGPTSGFGGPDRRREKPQLPPPRHSTMVSPIEGTYTSMFAPALQKLEKSLEKQSFSDTDPKFDKLAYVEFAEGEDQEKRSGETSPWNLYFGEYHELRSCDELTITVKNAAAGFAGGGAIGSASINMKKLFPIPRGSGGVYHIPIEGPYAGDGEIFVSIANVGAVELTAENFGFADEDHTVMRVGSITASSQDGSFRRHPRASSASSSANLASAVTAAPKVRLTRPMVDFGSSMSSIPILSALCSAWD